MSKQSIKEKLDQLFQDHQVPMEYSSPKAGQHLYKCGYPLDSDRKRVGELDVWAHDYQDQHDQTEFQIILRQLYQLKKENRRQKALEAVNQLNLARTGIYTLVLSDDGEIFLRLMDMVDDRVEKVGQYMNLGVRMAQQFAPELENEINS